MDLEAFEKQLREAREFDVRAGEITLRLLLPTPGQYRELSTEFAEDGQIPPRALARFERRLAEVCIIGWRGLRARDIRGNDDAGVDFSPAALALVLDYRVDLQDLAITRLIAEKRRRDVELEADRKNSKSGSPGKETSGRRAASEPSASTSSAIRPS